MEEALILYVCLQQMCFLVIYLKYTIPMEMVFSHLVDIGYILMEKKLLLAVTMTMEMLLPSTVLRARLVTMQ